MKTRYMSWSVLLLGLLAACSGTPAPESAAETRTLHDQVVTSLNDFKAKDPTLIDRIDKAYAYAIFPDVTTGALIVGGAHGRGEVYQGGALVGYADVSQASVGAQVGGQQFAQLVLFQNEGAFAEFKSGDLTFDARATAIAAASGAAATADYRRGVMVFSLPQGGLMVQAAIGGQKFRYSPK